MGEKKIAILFSLIFLAIMAFMVQVSPYTVKGNDFYKNEAEEVLEGYPELNGTEILFKEKSISHTMRARPQIIPILRGERKYKIIINNGSGKYNGIPVKKLTREQRIGVIAHEMSHLEDYENKNALELLIFGIKYFLPSYKESIEK